LASPPPSGERLSSSTRFFISLIEIVNKKGSKNDEEKSKAAPGYNRADRPEIEFKVACDV